jgi:hypothetical protein
MSTVTWKAVSDRECSITLGQQALYLVERCVCLAAFCGRRCCRYILQCFGTQCLVSHCRCALLCLAPLCTPGVVGGVVILSSMSQTGVTSESKKRHTPVVVLVIKTHNSVYSRLLPGKSCSIHNLQSAIARHGTARADLKIWLYLLSNIRCKLQHLITL